MPSHKCGQLYGSMSSCVLIIYFMGKNCVCIRSLCFSFFLQDHFEQLVEFMSRYKIYPDQYNCASFHQNSVCCARAHKNAQLE